jgi:hypothetical protein
MVLMVKEQLGTEGLVLGGGGNIFCDGQMGKEGCDFWNAHAVLRSFCRR